MWRDLAIYIYIIICADEESLEALHESPKHSHHKSKGRKLRL